MYQNNKSKIKSKAAPVGANEASTSREGLFQEQEQHRLHHEKITGVNREEFDKELHAKAESIWDGYSDRERRALRGVLSTWYGHLDTSRSKFIGSTRAN